MARHANQLTLRDIDPRVLAEVQRVAAAEGLSMNKAAAKLLKQGAGIADAVGPRRIGSAIDRFVGTLSRSEARRLSRSMEAMERVDDELWK